MQIRPSINLSVLPAALTLQERFELAANAGFGGIELEVHSGSAAALRAAANRTDMVIHSVHCLANYSLPLSSSDCSVAAAGARATIQAIQMAKQLGADTVLLIPGVVAADVSYQEVYQRSCDVIRREILPAAEDHGVVLAIENVWNGFLLSPIDYAQFVDEFRSPWVRAYLDVGNIIFGHPEGWIDVLGARICKLHIKDLKFRLATGRRPSKLGEGDIDWARVRAALERVGYSGWAVLSEPEEAQPWIMPRIYNNVIRRETPPGLPVLRGAWGRLQTIFARALLRDVMSHFRSHFDLEASGDRIPETKVLSRTKHA